MSKYPVDANVIILLREGFCSIFWWEKPLFIILKCQYHSDLWTSCKRKKRHATNYRTPDNTWWSLRSLPTWVILWFYNSGYDFSWNLLITRYFKTSGKIAHFPPEVVWNNLCKHPGPIWLEKLMMFYEQRSKKPA